LFQSCSAEDKYGTLADGTRWGAPVGIVQRTDGDSGCKLTEEEYFAADLWNELCGRHSNRSRRYHSYQVERTLEMKVNDRRWGGNSVTRYNYEIDVQNTGTDGGMLFTDSIAASDYYFENIPGCEGIA
jgi:hypothetical protein